MCSFGWSPMCKVFSRLDFSNILKGIAGINYVSFFTVYVSKNFIFPSKTNSEKARCTSECFCCSSFALFLFSRSAMIKHGELWSKLENKINFTLNPKNHTELIFDGLYLPPVHVYVYRICCHEALWVVSLFHPFNSIQQIRPVLSEQRKIAAK